jgi:hypothetical protein
MSLVNLCGVPSLWMENKEYATGGSGIMVTNSKGSPVEVMEPFIKPF